MSALGHKRTFYAAVRESALPPKADIRGPRGAVAEAIKQANLFDYGQAGYRGYGENSTLTSVASAIAIGYSRSERARNTMIDTYGLPPVMAPLCYAYGLYRSPTANLDEE